MAMTTFFLLVRLPNSRCNCLCVKVLHAMIEEGRTPNDPAFAVGFMTARKLGDPDFAKLLLETRSRAGMPLRHDFFVNVSA